MAKGIEKPKKNNKPKLSIKEKQDKKKAKATSPKAKGSSPSRCRAVPGRYGSLPVSCRYNVAFSARLAPSVIIMSSSSNDV